MFSKANVGGNIFFLPPMQYRRRQCGRTSWLSLAVTNGRTADEDDVDDEMSQGSAWSVVQRSASRQPTPTSTRYQQHPRTTEATMTTPNDNGDKKKHLHAPQRDASARYNCASTLRVSIGHHHNQHDERAIKNGQTNRTCSHTSARTRTRTRTHTHTYTHTSPTNPTNHNQH